jgi:Tfp pilus assembly protein PilZ
MEFNPAQPNRRSHPRVTVTTELSLGQDGLFARTTEKLTDVSLGGTFIKSTGNYQIGSILSLRFPVGQNCFITSTVIVRNARRQEGIGVQFLDLSPEGSERLRAFMENEAALQNDKPSLSFHNQRD